MRVLSSECGHEDVCAVHLKPFRAENSEMLSRSRAPQASPENLAYASATPFDRSIKSRDAISAAAGPETAAFPIIGPTATTGAEVSHSARYLIPGTARIGPMLVTGLLGRKSATASACEIVLILPASVWRPGLRRSEQTSPGLYTVAAQSILQS